MPYYTQYQSNVKATGDCSAVQGNRQLDRSSVPLFHALPSVIGTECWFSAFIHTLPLLIGMRDSLPCLYSRSSSSYRHGRHPSVLIFSLYPQLQARETSFRAYTHALPLLIGMSDSLPCLYSRSSSNYRHGRHPSVPILTLFLYL